MTVAERFFQFIELKQLRPRWVEQDCGLSNGYLAKQKKNKGSFGGIILQKIKSKFPELNMTWLVTGEGHMIITDKKPVYERAIPLVQDSAMEYGPTKEDLIRLLQSQIRQLESALRDKQKLIELMERKAFRNVS